MLKIGEATESGIKKKKLVAPKIGCAIMRVQNAKEIDNMTFGEKLSSLRKEANLTQKDLAVMLDVSRQAVTKWETGVGMPDIDNIKKIIVAHANCPAYLDFLFIILQILLVKLIKKDR